MNSSLWFSIWRVAIILAAAVAGLFLLRLFFRRWRKRLEKSERSEEQVKRLTTLLHAGYSIGNVLIVLVTALMIMYELGINIAPVLASAGVVGLAFSLGAQTLIKDLLAGVILLSENEFKIGDVVTIGETTGTVEHITLRATYLRDINGGLNIIPNGDIRSLSNLTSRWSQTIVTLNFDYSTDMERVVGVLEAAAAKLAEDKEFSAAVNSSPIILGWSGFTDWSVQAQMIVKTKPGKQWLAGRMLRKQALAELASEGIRLAVPLRRVEEVPTGE